MEDGNLSLSSFSDSEDEDDLLANELENYFINDVEEEEDVKRSTKTKRTRVPVRTNSELSSLPHDLIEHIFKHLSAEDVCSCSKTCKIFREVANTSESIWHRLYFSRWSSSDETGTEPKTRTTPAATSSAENNFWLGKYFAKDKKDMAAALQNVPLSQKRIYADVQASKRSEVPVQANDILLAASASHLKNVASSIRSWKERKGLVEVVENNHKCGKGFGCSYHRIGTIFLCEQSGREHRCGSSCDAQLLIDGEFVCGISGVTSTNTTEEFTVPKGANEDEEFGLINEPNFGGGFISNAFEQGYNCENEQELKEIWWIGYANGRKRKKTLYK